MYVERIFRQAKSRADRTMVAGPGQVVGLDVIAQVGGVLSLEPAAQAAVRSASTPRHHAIDFICT